MPVYEVTIIESEYRECKVKIIADNQDIAHQTAAKMQSDGAVEDEMVTTDVGVLIVVHPNYGGKRHKNEEKIA